MHCVPTALLLRDSKRFPQSSLSSGQTVVSTLVGIILYTGGAYIYLSSRQQDYLTPDTHTLTGGGQAGGSSQIIQGYAA